jgi:hypothetical protein
VSRHGVPVPSGRGRLRRFGPSRLGTDFGPDRLAGHGKADASLGYDYLLAKPDRAGSSPAKIGNGAGPGRWGTVRGCPLGTGPDRCEWHGSGTAGEDDRGLGLAVMAPVRAMGEARPGRPRASLASLRWEARQSWLCCRGLSRWAPPVHRGLMSLDPVGRFCLGGLGGVGLLVCLGGLSVRVEEALLCSAAHGHPADWRIAEVRKFYAASASVLDMPHAWGFLAVVSTLTLCTPGEAPDIVTLAASAGPPHA